LFGQRAFALSIDEQTRRENVLFVEKRFVVDEDGHTVAEYSSYTSAVKEIQDLIDRESNFPGTKLAVDGSFGPLTFSAVEWLQSHDHICGGVDGVVGSCTWAYLRG